VSGRATSPAEREAVVIVDDHPITGAGIAAQLMDAGFRVATVTRSVEEVPVPFDVAVCDLRLPSHSGPEAIALLAAHGKHVLATSGVAGQQEILDAVASGAHGYLPKTAPVTAYARAIRHLIGYTRYVSSELACMLLTDAQHRPLTSGELDARAHQVLRLFEKGEDADEVSRDMRLDAGALSRVLAEVWDRAAARRTQWRPSVRERELIELIADGWTRKEAAVLMSISVMTVSGYLKSIKSKYLTTHPGASSAITPLAAARSWAEESGFPASGEPGRYARRTVGSAASGLAGHVRSRGA
jgi:DNA-binding NarL/FixJ family response regulator